MSIHSRQIRPECRSLRQDRNWFHGRGARKMLYNSSLCCVLGVVEVYKESHFVHMELLATWGEKSWAQSLCSAELVSAWGVDVFF